MNSKYFYIMIFCKLNEKFIKKFENIIDFWIFIMKIIMKKIQNKNKTDKELKINKNLLKK